MWAASLRDDLSTGGQVAPLKDQEGLLAVLRRDGNIRSYGIIKRIMGAGIIDSLPLRVRCECSALSCEEIIEISLARRREIRRKFPRGFIVASLHTCSPNDVSLFNDDKLSILENPRYSEPVTDL